MNLLARAERSVLMRALVAVVLIAAILILATTTSRADPTESVRITSAPTYTVTTRSIGSGRPAGCPRLWCGCWARLQAGVNDTRYNLALAWLSFQHVPKQVGAWAVMRRRGGGHVGRVVAMDASGNPVIESGNHGGRVGTATYPRSRIVAYVLP